VCGRTQASATHIYISFKIRVIKYLNLGNYYYLVELQKGVLPDASGTTIRHVSHEITHHAQIKHNTQNYTNNKGHIARS
jgi:hypothetical protein